MKRKIPHSNETVKVNTPFLAEFKLNNIVPYIFLLSYVTPTTAKNAGKRGSRHLMMMQ